MVAAWGGYVFIINIIPIYVVVMVIAGRYSSRLYIAYSTFYALGSIMAMQVRAGAPLLVFLFGAAGFSLVLVLVVVFVVAVCACKFLCCCC